MLNILLVAVGGATGSVLRYLVGLAFAERVNSNFPFATFTVNMVGCFAIGILVQTAESREWLTPEVRALLQVGLLGGFTTFSSFGNEAVNLWQKEQAGTSLLYLALSVGLGLGAVWLGRQITAWLLPVL